MPTREEIKNILKRNKSVLKNHKVNKIGLFGSYATGKEKKTSDIDLLVDFSSTIDLFEFVHLTQDLEDILQAKVDVATPDALKHHVKARILGEVEWIQGL